MFRLAREADLSPEKMAKILGVSGMTLRRWRTKPPQADLPKLYERAFATGVEQLVADGHVDPNSRLAQSVMSDAQRSSFQATLKTLGLSDMLLRRKGNPNDVVIEAMSHIGASPSHVKDVEEGGKKLSFFAKMGEGWKSRIQGMLNVIRSPQLTMLDKLVAYGALFYLLTPFDLIPDTIPAFGLLDDYSVLTLALAYYVSRFPNVVNMVAKGPHRHG